MESDVKDREFLMWLHQRLQFVHNESSIVDYMHKLRAIIHDTPADRESINDGRGKNGLDELREVLK